VTNQAPSDDVVPVSVQLGEVVPPDDPEDWTRPLTWAAAAGMLGAPLVALAWFWLAVPDGTKAPAVGTWLVAVALAAGASLAGATQQGAARAFAGTLAAALFAALATVAVGLMIADERQVGVASPALGHAVAASVAGVAGALPAGLLALRLAGWRSRRTRILVPAAIGAGVAVVVVPLLFLG
jgi:MFS family permease